MLPSSASRARCPFPRARRSPAAFVSRWNRSSRAPPWPVDVTTVPLRRRRSHRRRAPAPERPQPATVHARAVMTARACGPAIALAFAVALAAAGCDAGGPAPAPQPLVDDKLPAGFPAGSPATLAPADNALTEARAQLGKRLFFDKQLSRTGLVSCGTCHLPENAFSDPKPVSAGVDDRRGTRNAPALVNLAWGDSLLLGRPRRDAGGTGGQADRAPRRDGPAAARRGGAHRRRRHATRRRSTMPTADR